MKGSSAIFVLTLLAIEFLDEFIFGAREAAWPLMHTDLGLSYVQIGLLLAAYHTRTPTLPHPHTPRKSFFKAGVIDALHALRRREVLRWLTLLECSDLMLDVLLGFLALYFVDVVGATPAQAGAAVAVWTGVGLMGLFNTGWYPVLKAQLYSAMPGQASQRVSESASQRLLADSLTRRFADSPQCGPHPLQGLG